MKREHYATVTDNHTTRTVTVVSNPSGALIGTCSTGKCEPMTSAGGNDVLQNAKNHLYWHR